jgi:cell filamentation protein
MADPYLFSGTRVLQNKLGLMDACLLQDAENRFSTVRAYELLSSKRKLSFTAQSWKAIHKTLFNDLYAWSGQFRTIYISKANRNGITKFLAYERIAAESTKAMSHLGAVLRHAQSDPIDRVMSTLADVYIEMNHIHPFREGNGRAQKFLFRSATQQNGIVLDCRKVSHEDHIEAAVQGNLGDPSMMRQQFIRMGRRTDCDAA